MSILKIPYGISNYRIIAEEGYAFVDKTCFIRILEDNSDPYIVFLRPRRFGKSLFVSILNYYYDISEKDHFERFFLETNIGRNPTPARGSFYILNFDFSGIETDSIEKLRASFFLKTSNSLLQFNERYKINLNLIETGSSAGLLSEFFSKVSGKINRPIYVIIDEYDHFANELLSFNFSLFQDSITENGFIRKWYEVLKEATKTVVRKIFITGVSPITLDSLTSGFNIAKNLTRSPRLNEMMGFTEDEVRHLISHTLPEELIPPDMGDILRQYYNGYLFSEDSDHRIFNSDMILYYISASLDRRRPPEQLLDTNIASDYSKIGRLLRLKSPDRNINILRDIVENGQVFTRITEQFSMEKRFSDDDFKSLLFYLGFLTIKESLPGRLSLQIPNYVIRGLYYDFFLEKIASEVQYSLNTENIVDAIYQIAYYGKCDKLVTLIEELLHAFSNRDFIGFDEKYLKIVLFTYANMSNLYLVKSEYEVPDGYIDIALLKRDPWHPDYYALFELKYLKVKESKPIDVERAVLDGKSQLEKYVSSKELSIIQNLKKWVLVFAGDKSAAVVEI